MSVLEYFREHPGAAADLERVSRWRLLHHEMTRLVEETERALSWLVSRGLLLRIDVTGVAPKYRLSPKSPPASGTTGRRSSRGGRS
jgi:hypothetical protein